MITSSYLFNSLLSAGTVFLSYQANNELEKEAHQYRESLLQKVSYLFQKISFYIEIGSSFIRGALNFGAICFLPAQHLLLFPFVASTFEMIDIAVLTMTVAGGVMASFAVA